MSRTNRRRESDEIVNTNRASKKNERRVDRKNVKKKLSEIDTRYIDQWDDDEDQHIIRGTN